MALGLQTSQAQEEPAAERLVEGFQAHPALDVDEEAGVHIALRPLMLSRHPHPALRPGQSHRRLPPTPMKVLPPLLPARLHHSSPPLQSQEHCHHRPLRPHTGSTVCLVASSSLITIQEPSSASPPTPTSSPPSLGNETEEQSTNEPTAVARYTTQPAKRPYSSYHPPPP